MRRRVTYIHPKYTDFQCIENMAAVEDLIYQLNALTFSVQCEKLLKIKKKYIFRGGDFRYSFFSLSSSLPTSSFIFHLDFVLFHFWNSFLKHKCINFLQRS